jgi:hypothetical protein
MNMHHVSYDYREMEQNSAPNARAQKGLSLGRLGYVLAVNAGLTTISFMLILLSYL